jgi:FAD/FMN-containing dehydrogenase
MVRCLSEIRVLRHPLEYFSFSEEDSDLVCQPGVGWMEINETLKEKGIPLFFPVRVTNATHTLPNFHLHPQLDPGPTATVGGMLSTGCSGSQCCAIVNVTFTVTNTFSRQPMPSAMARRRANGS